LDVIDALNQQGAVLGLLPLLVAPRDHEQGLGGELRTACASLVAVARHLCVGVAFSGAFVGKRSYAIGESRCLTSRRTGSV